jgi:hypothetical protein
MSTFEGKKDYSSEVALLIPESEILANEKGLNYFQLKLYYLIFFLN